PTVLAHLVVDVNVQDGEGKGLFQHGSVAADGSFRFAPVPAGNVQLSVRIGRQSVASLHDASGVTGPERDDELIVLASGETRDVGVLAATFDFFHGTVRDASGEAVASAEISEPARLPSTDEEDGDAEADADVRIF